MRWSYGLVLELILPRGWPYGLELWRARPDIWRGRGDDEEGRSRPEGPSGVRAACTREMLAMEL